VAFAREVSRWRRARATLSLCAAASNRSSVTTWAHAVGGILPCRERHSVLLPGLAEDAWSSEVRRLATGTNIGWLREWDAPEPDACTLCGPDPTGLAAMWPDQEVQRMDLRSM